MASRDHVYCLELAKRSVARAALHLGVPTMTRDVLDVMGDVLCQYLERLSAVLAQGVESSGRSTQHVNALDVLQAVELCTSPAVSCVHFTGSGRQKEDGTTTTTTTTGTGTLDTTTMNPLATSSTDTADMDRTTNGDDERSNADNKKKQWQSQHPPGSWQSLAAFCFGPSWQEEPSSKELQVAQLKATGAGGKVGPSATTNQQEESAKDVQEGWRAPFPDEVLPFPLTSTISMMSSHGHHHSVLSQTGTAGAVYSVPSGRVSNPHPMTHQQVLVALYGKEHPDTSKSAADMIRGKDLVSAERAEKERNQTDTNLGNMPASAWGGLTPAMPTSAIKPAAADNDDVRMADVTTTDATSSKAGHDSTKVAGNKRKSEATDSNGGISEGDHKSKDDVANQDSTKKIDDADAIDKNDESKGNGSKPAMKKVKLEDGSAKTTKESTPAKKKRVADKKDREDEAAAEVQAVSVAKDKAEAAAAAARAAMHEGRTYNYVPTFYPPIPNMSSRHDRTHLRKVTVVELKDSTTSSNTANGAADGPSHLTSKNATTATARTSTANAVQLRSALVQLGTSYWGSSADASAEPASNVPAGRGSAESAVATPASVQLPIVPLGRASGSRVSRILEGSMDAAAMQ